MRAVVVPLSVQYVTVQPVTLLCVTGSGCIGGPLPYKSRQHDQQPWMEPERLPLCCSAPLSDRRVRSHSGLTHQLTVGIMQFLAAVVLCPLQLIIPDHRSSHLPSK